MTRTLRMVLIAASLAAMAALGSGCGGTKNLGTLGNFVMALNGFDAHIGQTFYLKIIDTETGGIVALSNPSQIDTAGFSINFPNVIHSGREYRIDFWVDVDNNGVLDRSPDGTPAGVDASWRELEFGGESGLALTFTYDTDFADITPF